MRGTQYLVWVRGQQHPPRYRGDPPARARGRAPRSLGLEEAAGAQRDALHLLLLLLVHSVPPAEAGDPVSIPTGDDLRLLGAAPGPELGLQYQFSVDTDTQRRLGYPLSKRFSNFKAKREKLRKISKICLLIEVPIFSCV